MRIIAGEFKNREVLSPADTGRTRPMTGSVKKSLFAMLGEDLSNMVVLDLYCGTGTMGIEALSRGARLCCFAERDADALGRLKRNIDTLGLAGRSIIWRGDITHRLAKWLAELTEPADVAFVDPPYADARKWDWPTVESQIFAPLAGKLATDGTVMLRLPGKLTPPQTVGALALKRVRNYGDMTVALLGHASQ